MAVRRSGGPRGRLLTCLAVGLLPAALAWLGPVAGGAGLVAAGLLAGAVERDRPAAAGALAAVPTAAVFVARLVLDEQPAGLLAPLVPLVALTVALSHVGAGIALRRRDGVAPGRGGGLG